MTRFFFLLVAGGALGWLGACTEARESTLDTSAESAVLSSLSMLSGSVHLLNSDNSGLTRASQESLFWDKLFPFRVPAAYATISDCSQAAAADTCIGETKNASYNDCPIGGLGMLFGGTVVLTFTPAAGSCAFTASGATVTRSVSLTRTTVGGGQIVTSSGSRSDYLGQSYGGGARLTRNDATHYSLNLLGLHKVRTNAAGSEITDISMRTTTNFDFLGTPTGSFTLDGGVLEVAHNNAKYLASVTASDVTYDYATCCYPLGGAFNVTYSGKVTGTAAVSFGSTCGEITFARDGVSTDFDLLGCE